MSQKSSRSGYESDPSISPPPSTPASNSTCTAPFDPRSTTIMSRKSLPTFLLLFFVVLGSPILVRAEEEEFSEALLLKPLADSKVLAHFHFQSRAPDSVSNGKHHHIFPKAVSQLVKKFHVHEMELSFTQGRWNYARWGASDLMSSTNAKPPGVELWAVLDVPVDQIDVTWKGLTHALSGMFCSSINFLESPASYTAPHWAFNSNMSNMRYGALPREAVCTENLTPWLKLLPCRDKAGIASLLDRPSIYKGFYHSQKMRLLSTKEAGIVIDQTLTVVLQPDEWKPDAGDPLLQPSWSISMLFKKKVTGHCILAKSSNIFLELEKGLVAELEKLGPMDSWNKLGFKLSFSPDRILKDANDLDSQSGPVLYEYNLKKYSESAPLDLGIKWKLPFVWSCSKAPFEAIRFLMGSGNERGSVAISLQSTQSNDWYVDVGDECRVQVVVLQIVPWYVKVYYHTLKIFVDGEEHNIVDVVEKMQVHPSEDKISPGTMELMLMLPCRSKSATITIDFDKGFLHIDEYPPDANQGFDIPSAIVSFPQFQVSTNFIKETSVEKSPLLLKFLERSVIRSYTEVLLVPLTTPDFSMPYNVITFTCTVLALYFGSLLNVLRRRIGEEERLLSKAAERQGLIPQLLSKLKTKLRGNKPEPTAPGSSFLNSKLLLKVVVVAIAAVIWHYFFNDQ